MVHDQIIHWQLLSDSAKDSAMSGPYYQLEWEPFNQSITTRTARYQSYVWLLSDDKTYSWVVFNTIEGWTKMVGIADSQEEACRICSKLMEI